jgi:hypothetical protein
MLRLGYHKGAQFMEKILASRFGDTDTLGVALIETVRRVVT